MRGVRFAQALAVALLTVAVAGSQALAQEVADFVLEWTVAHSNQPSGTPA